MKANIVDQPAYILNTVHSPLPSSTIETEEPKYTISQLSLKVMSSHVTCIAMPMHCRHISLGGSLAKLKERTSLRKNSFFLERFSPFYSLCLKISKGPKL